MKKILFCWKWFIESWDSNSSMSFWCYEKRFTISFYTITVYKENLYKELKGELSSVLRNRPKIERLSRSIGSE